MKATFEPLRIKQGFPLLDVREPELYREQFPYEQIPRIFFDGTDVGTKPAPEHVDHRTPPSATGSRRGPPTRPSR